MAKKTGREIAYILMPILYGLLAIGVGMLVCWSGQYPYGSETMAYVYRGDVVFNAIKDGNLFPLYDSMWYNGMELFKFCAPLPTYFMAFCQAIAGGDPTDGYLVFVGLVYFMCALSWLFVGKKRNRVLLGSFIGLLWFFMPNNLYVMFQEGNLFRGFCMIFLPLFISFAYDYIWEGKLKDLIKAMILYGCMALCDFEYMLMVAIGVLIYVVINGIFNHQWKKSLFLLLGMLLAFMIVGVWTVPYMIATAGISYDEVMYRYFQNIFISLNPVERLASLNRHYYFGLAAFILAVFGIVYSKRKSMPGFWTGVLILIGTISSMYPIMQIMPGSNHLLMCQYISLGLCFILYGFLSWDSLRKPLQIFLCVLLLLDVMPSLNLVYGTLNGVPVAERFDEQNETTLIAKAKEVCQQRIALLDGSELETMGSYLVSKYENGKAATFGSDWHNAATSTNIVQLNKAVEGGFYPYLFDRCKELGNDTVLIKLSQINQEEAPVELLDAAALEQGYELVDSNEFYRLYDMDIDGNWGTVTKYSAIGIGDKASVLSLYYPAVKEVTTTNLNNFTFEELSQYELIYLSGFTYNDRASAEKLIRDLSEAGVRIVILADGIPEDRTTHTKDFLGITCNTITFTNGYPLLDTRVGVLDCDFFPQGFGEWNTVYVNGLDETWGTVLENDMELDFYGTVENDNIVVLGLNLTYFYSLTQDAGVGELLAGVTEFAENEMPERQIVPLEITYGKDLITITSEQDNVNTSLAYHEMFTSMEPLEEENHLLYVDAGTTQIEMDFFEFYFGFSVSLMGFMLAVIFLYMVYRYNRRMKRKLEIKIESD